MNPTPSPAQDSAPAEITTPVRNLTVRIFGIGTPGLRVLEHLVRDGISSASCVAVATDAVSLATSSAGEKIHLETKLLRGLGTGGDPERGRALAEEHFSRLKAVCEGADVALIAAGLGGGAGTGVGPVLARAAKEAGALVLGFVTTPFECEGNRRQRLAEAGLYEIKNTADGVICLPNDKLFGIIDENTSVLDTFEKITELLAEGMCGVWRLLVHPALIQIHFADICELLRDRHGESTFAVAEAAGPTRSREVADKLLAHPLLEGGQALRESDAVIVGLMGGRDLTMAEVRRVVQDIGKHAEHAQVIMGAAINESFDDRLSVTVIAAGKVAAPRPEVARGAVPEGLEHQLLSRTDPPRQGSRFVPPPPDLSNEQIKELTRRHPGVARPRKSAPRFRQVPLPLEIVSKGRFENSQPTIHKGEDLDVPTYIRRGIALN